MALFDPDLELAAIEKETRHECFEARMDRKLREMRDTACMGYGALLALNTDGKLDGVLNAMSVIIFTDEGR
jgi:hypothetical protein